VEGCDSLTLLLPATIIRSFFLFGKESVQSHLHLPTFKNFTVVIMIFLLGFTPLVTFFGAIKMFIFKNKIKINQITKMLSRHRRSLFKPKLRENWTR
jgi:hypothetical protein